MGRMLFGFTMTNGKLFVFGGEITIISGSGVRRAVPFPRVSARHELRLWACWNCMNDWQAPQGRPTIRTIYLNSVLARYHGQIEMELLLAMSRHRE